MNNIVLAIYVIYNFIQSTSKLWSNSKNLLIKTMTPYTKVTKNFSVTEKKYIQDVFRLRKNIISNKINNLNINHEYKNKL